MIKGKGPRNSKLTGQIVLVLQKMELNARWIEERRSQVTFTPSQREEVDAFLRDVPVEETPLGAFLVGMRAQREEKERLLEEARKSGRGEDAMSGVTEGARREGKKGRGKKNERRGGKRVAHARDMEVEDGGMDESE
jgi:nucleolar complex protein 2